MQDFYHQQYDPYMYRRGGPKKRYFLVQARPCSGFVLRGSIRLEAGLSVLSSHKPLEPREIGILTGKYEVPLEAFGVNAGLELFF